MKTFRMMVLAGALSTVFSIAYAVDDSVWINTQIKTAIANGQSEYVLPAGVYNIQSDIWIPPGTKNFTLRGAGPDQTVIMSPDKSMAQAISVGVVPILFNNYGIANRPCTSVESVNTGDRVVTAKAGQTALSPGYYVLFDDGNIVCPFPPNYQSLNHAEIVKVVAVDSTGTKATIDVPAGREYSKNVRLADIKSTVCTNITVKDIGYDGLNASGASKGILLSGLVDGLHVDNLKVRNFISEAMALISTRNALIENCDIGDAYGSGGTGAGYGYTIYRSRFVTLRNCVAQNKNANSGYIIHSGTLDALIEDCKAVDNAKFDMHGYDSRRVTFRRCTGPNISIGNYAWRGGEKDVVIEDSQFTTDLFIGTNVKGIRVSNCEFGGGVSFESTTGTAGSPSGGYPDQVLIEDCSFKGSNYTVLAEPTKTGVITFVRSKFLNTNTSFGAAVRLMSMEGVINFLNCNFETSSSRTPVELYNPNPKFVINMRACSLHSAYSNEGVYVKSTFVGRAILQLCTFTSGASGKLVFLVDNSKRVTSSKNTVAKAL